MSQDTVQLGVNNSSDSLISAKELIHFLKNSGVKFGKADPLRRLRYYVNLGLIPKPTKKLDVSKEYDKSKPPPTTSFYPSWVAEKIVKIEADKKSGISVQTQKAKSELEREVKKVKQDFLTSTPALSPLATPTALFNTAISPSIEVADTPKENQLTIDDFSRESFNRRAGNFLSGAFILASIPAFLIVGVMLANNFYSNTTSQSIVDSFRNSGENLIASFGSGGSEENSNIADKSFLEKAGEVLARTTAPYLKINVETEITKLLNAFGGIKTNGADADLGIGELTASNVIYDIVAGDNITVSDGQTPTISASSTTGVGSVTGTTGRITSSGGDNPVLNIATNYTGQTSITTLGTIGTGTWNGTALTDAFVSDTLTIDGTGSVAWTALNTFPAACAATDFVRAVGTTLTCAADGSGSATLQNVYDNGNNITTTDARDIEFDLADTVTDSDFIVDILGTGNTFEIQDGGTPFLILTDGQTITTSGTSTLDVDGTLAWGGATISENLDTNNNLITNIGNAGTDFTSGGGLNIADILNVNGDVNFSLGGAENFTLTNTTFTNGAIASFTGSSTSILGDKYGIYGDFNWGGAFSTEYGLYLDVEATGAFGPGGFGSYIDITSNQVIGSGTENIYGGYFSAINNNDTGGTGNTYGVYSTVTGDPDGTTNAYAFYATATGADNNYGLYVSAGDAYVAGHSAFGASAGVDNDQVITITESNSSAFVGFDGIDLSVNGTGAGQTIRGINILSQYSGTSGTSNVNGLDARAYYSSTSGTATVTDLAALSVDISTVGSTAGAVTNSYGLQIGGAQIGGGDIKPTSSYGIRVGDQSIAGITNTYGIYIEDQTNSTNNYALYLEGTGGTASTGITFGADTNLYRSGANTLQTDDDLAINGGDITSSGDLTITPAGGDTNIVGVLDVNTTSLAGNPTILDLADTSQADTGSWLYAIARCASCYSPGAGIGSLVLRSNQTDDDFVITADNGATKSFAVESDNDVYVAENLYIGQETATDDDFIYFDTGTSEFLMWDDAPGEFEFSDDLTVSGNLSTTGTLTMGTPATANSERLCWDASGSSLITDCTGSPGDYAEEYGTSDSSIEAGDLVVIDSDRQAEEVVTDGELGSKAWVLKSSKPYESSLLGVVSTNPNEVIGQNFDQNENPRPVALNGRLPVKVSTENGPIAPGDPLTSSSTPGVAMSACAKGFGGSPEASSEGGKAYQCRSGPIVGKALSSYSGSSVGSVMVFISVGWYVAPLNIAPIDGSTELIANTPILFGDNLISLDESGRIRVDGDLLIAGNIHIDGNLTINGVITAQEITTDQLFLTDESSGSSLLQAGNTTITINNSNVSQNSKVIVTFTSNWSPASRYWVEKEQGKFVVRLDNAVNSATSFDWLIVQGGR